MLGERRGDNLSLEYHSLCKRLNLDAEDVCSALKHKLALARCTARCRLVALSFLLNPKEVLLPTSSLKR